MDGSSAQVNVQVKSDLDPALSIAVFLERLARQGVEVELPFGNVIKVRLAEEPSEDTVLVADRSRSW